MRLRSFTAATMTEALRQVRAELGDDAVIVSSHDVDGGTGVHITAAIERHGSETVLAGDIGLAGDVGLHGSAELDREICEALGYHGTPQRLTERLSDAVHGSDGEPLTALSQALRATFAFTPLPEAGGGPPLALVGPPGAGKTISIAKLAARAILAGTPVRVITADGFRAGGVEQLATLTEVLGTDLQTATSPNALEQAVKTGDPGDLVLIDTAGINPFSKDDVVRLAELTNSVGAEPVLTLAAGGDASDALEIGEVFAAIGATRMLVTRLDAARRLGAVLAAADGGSLGFSDVSINPHVSRGLRPLDPQALARLLLCHQQPSETTGQPDEAQE